MTLDETDQRLISEGGDIDPKQYINFRDDIQVGEYEIKGIALIVLGNGPNRYSSDEGLGVSLVDTDEDGEPLYLLAWEYPSETGTRTDFAIAEGENMVKAVKKSLLENEGWNIIWRNEGEYSEAAEGLVIGAKERFGEERIQLDDQASNDIDQDPNEWPLQDLPENLGRCSEGGREHNETDFYRTDSGDAVCALCGMKVSTES
jgi:hypothetical protein